MIHQFCRAFGYLILKHDIQPGETISDNFTVNNVFNVSQKINYDVTPDTFNEKDYSHIWLFTKGSTITTNLDSGEQFVKRAGYCSVVDEHPFGNFSVEFTEPTTFFCLSPNINLKMVPVLPKVGFFHMKAGEKRVINKDAKIFLAGGVLKTLDSTKFVNELSQLVLTSDTEFEAVLDCYGYFFN